jgi:hypothetical protein
MKADVLENFAGSKVAMKRYNDGAWPRLPAA